MENSLSYYRKLLMENIEEKELSPKQKKIARLNPPKDKMDAGDFEDLRNMKKEGVEEHHNDPNFPGGPAIRDLLDRVAEDWGTNSDLYNKLEDAIVANANKNGNLIPMGKEEIKRILDDYDVLDNYGWLLDPKPADHTGETISMNEVDMQELETEDHEVSMANNSLESILKHAMELKAKLGNEEKDIPAWIQDHITNAANFISQAAENYHEYGDQEGEEDPDQEMSLENMMEDLFEAKKKKKSKPSQKDKEGAKYWKKMEKEHFKEPKK